MPRSNQRRERARPTCSARAIEVTPSLIGRREARELRRRSERIGRTGGVPHAQVVAEMRRDMDRDLRAMVRAYKHPGRKLTEILECMAIARGEGIDIAEPCRELLDKVAARTRARAA